MYDQISILRNSSKVKLCCAVSLGLGLKGVKIAWILVKFGILHSFLSNGHPNLWSIFNYEKLVKSETPLCSFVRFWLKHPKIALNIVKVVVHSYLPNAHLNQWSNFNFKKLVKSEIWSCCFAKVGVKEGENSSERCERLSAHLSTKWASKSMIKF